jgi:glycerophosphoryl diester phosphodiesterase
MDTAWLIPMKIPAIVRFVLCFVAVIVTSAAGAPVATVYKLILHRGGVVEDKFPDNSAAALRAAVARKVWMLEVDIRETKDGVLVMRHDPDLKLNYRDPRQVRESTWEEIRHLRSDISEQHLWRFEDLVKEAHDAGLKLMLDSKDPHSADFCAKVEAILNKHNMVGSCYVIGTRDSMDHFTGKALVGLKFGALKTRLEADPSSKRNYFLFGQGDMTEDMVKWAQAQGVKVVPSINVYHYYEAKTMAGKPRAELEKIIFTAAKRDIDKFKALGVTEFQIDSEFMPWFER